MVVLPGAGHGPYGDIFDRFAERAAEDGLLVLRFQSWEDHEELARKTLGDLHAEIDAAVAFLAERGCTRISVVGKSFGGGVALTHVPDAVARIVLWAPAIGVGDEPNLDESRRMDLREANLRIDPPTLGTIETPVRILHGDEDHIPFENSRKLVDGLRDAELIEVEGADHSFLGPEEGVEGVTIEHTMEFLTGRE